MTTTTTTEAVTASAAAVAIPGYVAGRWVIDPVHSDVSFTVRHLMVSKVRGHFGGFSGEIVTGADPLDSSVVASIDVASVDTNNETRDAHLRSADFFAVDAHPTASFRSTGVQGRGDDLVITGDLTLKGVTQRVAVLLEVNGFGPDGQGGTRAGFSGRFSLSRDAFGIGTSFAAGQVAVLSDAVEMTIDIEAILQPQS